MSKPIKITYLYHKDTCFFISTIERSFGGGLGSGFETMVWECDPKDLIRGKQQYSSCTDHSHDKICEYLKR